MQTYSRFLISSIVCLLNLSLAGCDVEATDGDDSTFRAAYWDQIQCVNGTCWGRHPMAATDDLWAKLTTMDQLNALVANGRYIEDAAGLGFGYGSCAEGDFPTTMPVVHCWTINGTGLNRCYGGDGTYFTEIKPACEQVAGFLAANTNYPAGSCDAMPQWPWPVFDWMMGHNTKLNVTRVGWDGDSFLLYPACSNPALEYPCCSCDAENILTCVQENEYGKCPEGTDYQVDECV